MKYVLLILICTLLCCTSNKKVVTESGISVINLSEKVSKTSSLSLSDAAATIDIVPLEVTDESLIGNVFKVRVTDNDIWIEHVIEGDALLYRFSRSGSYLNKVGKIGQGPEEYIRLSDFVIDEDEREVYIITTVNGIKVYDFEGNYKRRENLFLSHFFSATKEQFILYHQTFFLSQNLCVVRPIANPKDSLWSIALVDSAFQKRKIFKNPSHTGREEQIVENRGNKATMVNYWEESASQFDKYNDELTLKYPDTDTIYRYDMEKEAFIPQYSILMKEEKGEYEFTHSWIKDRKAFDYFTIIRYYPTKDFIYLVGNKGENIHTFCYNKKDGSVRRQVRKDKIIERKLPWFFQSHRYLERPFVLENDLSGEKFTVEYRSEGKYWIDVLIPESEDNWIDMDRVKASTVTNEAKKNEFVKVLENINEDSNPIILIAILKRAIWMEYL
jgi:hypothetical protein